MPTEYNIFTIISDKDLIINNGFSSKLLYNKCKDDNTLYKICTREKMDSKFL